MAHAFSASSLRLNSPAIRRLTGELLRVLDRLSTGGRSIEMDELFERYTADVIGAIGFAQDFRCLAEAETSKRHPMIAYFASILPVCLKSGRMGIMKVSDVCSDVCMLLECGSVFVEFASKRTAFMLVVAEFLRAPWCLYSFARRY